MFKNKLFKRTSNETNNIFKIGRKDYLYNLNFLYKDICYEKTKDGNILKIFFNNHKFDWELYIILTLEQINLNIIPKILNVEYNKTGSYIEFDTKDLFPLREIFENNEYNFHLIINELLSFLRQIRMKKITIGNLHIDNIYINLNTMRFYILDLSNTTFSDSTVADIDLQSLYISLRETQVKDNIVDYFDKEMELFNNKLSKYSFTTELLELYK